MFTLIPFFLIAAALSPSSPLSDGDAVVALAWERMGGNKADPATSCVEVREPTSAMIRVYDRGARWLFYRSSPEGRSQLLRLKRIANGEGKVLNFDMGRLGLRPPWVGCKNRYAINVPVKIDGYAYVHVGMECGSLYGTGELRAFQHRDGAWRIDDLLVLWDS